MRNVFLIFALLFCGLAHAQTLYSKTFYASGSCNGQDQLATLGSADGTVSQFAHPWEPVPIRIIGVKITLFEAPVQYAYAGNYFSPNQMVFVARGEMSNAQPFFPVGTYFPFPAGPSTTYINLHFNCTTGRLQAWYTVYYTK